MKLTTKRLEIVMPEPEQFRLLLCGQDWLETAMGLERSGAVHGKRMRKALEWMYAMAAEDRENHEWHVYWQIILSRENRIIGGVGFKGPPNGRGEVEIGYSINSKDDWNKGYLTEAVSAMMGWAFARPGVKWVTAETDKDNLASRRVLAKNGMDFWKETDGGCFWRTGGPGMAAGK